MTREARRRDAMSLRRIYARGPWLGALILALAGCLAPVAAPPAPEDTRVVFVVRHGWHTRVALRLADIDSALWPESRALGDVAHIDVGWGDHDFYQADRGTVGLAIRAALSPTRAVLHVGGFDAPVGEVFAGQDIVRIEVPRSGLDRLARYAHASYARDAEGRPIRTRHGHYPISAFYEATGTYHVLNNSNHWTARALREAGVPMTPALAATAAGVMLQARRAGSSVP